MRPIRTLETETNRRCFAISESGLSVNLATTLLTIRQKRTNQSARRASHGRDSRLFIINKKNVAAMTFSIDKQVVGVGPITTLEQRLTSETRTTFNCFSKHWTVQRLFRVPRAGISVPTEIVLFFF